MNDWLNDAGGARPAPKCGTTLDLAGTEGVTRSGHGRLLTSMCAGVCVCVWGGGAHPVHARTDGPGLFPNQPLHQTCGGGCEPGLGLYCISKACACSIVIVFLG